MMIIGGSRSKSIAEDLSKLLKMPLIDLVSKRFPDGELYLRIPEEIKGHRIVVIQTAYPDESIIELLLILNAAREANADNITAVIPYMGYARQDRKFNEGEPISAKAIARIISIDADDVVTIDPHKEYISDFFGIPCKVSSAIPLIADYLKDKNIDMVLAPDKGALKRAEVAADILKCEVDYLEKTRIDGITIEVTPKKLDVNGKNIAIVDDIISTGGTIASSIEELKRQGAEKAIAACIHGVFAGNAIEKIRNAGCDEIVTTDTIPNPFSKVKVAPLLAEMLKGK
ncbi:MAG: ribose-phosphate diphosphokinase [Thermoplasmata archaeon]|nr:MAG: ribose-phosphate diphosphokinase [Thermoplasmata archaeon]